MRLESGQLVNLASGETAPLEDFSGQRVHLVSGLGNPQRFIDMLHEAGLETELHLFADHHEYSREDLAFDDDMPVIMTAKDAVKIRPFADRRCWYLALGVRPPADVINQVVTALKMKENNG